MGIFGKRQCKICGSPDRAKVDRLLAAGAGLRTIAAQFGFSVSGVGRHWQRHVSKDGSNDDAMQRLIESTQRALARSERKGNEKAVLDCLRLLTTLRTQNRIAAATASGSSAAAAPERPTGNQKNPSDLVSELRRIYGLTGPNWDKRIKERDEHDRDVELFERLEELVERTERERPRVAAAGTLLGSLLIGERPDEETMAEIKTLLLEGDDENGTAELVDETDEAGADEGIDTGPSNGGEERIDSPDVADHG